MRDRLFVDFVIVETFAPRSHFDNVGCPTPHSCDKRFALIFDGPVIFRTICSLNSSLYCTASAAFSPPGLFRSAQAATSLTQGEDLDSFLVEDALRLEEENVARTALAVDEEIGTVLGYVTVLNDAVRLLTKEKRRLGLATNDHPVVPALKIARLGVLSSAAGTGVGRELVRDAYLSARESANVGGCRLLTVDAYPGAVPFYEKLGFQKNRSPEYRDRENPSMRLDVFAPEPPIWL